MSYPAFKYTPHTSACLYIIYSGRPHQMNTRNSGCLPVSSKKFMKFGYGTSTYILHYHQN